MTHRDAIYNQHKLDYFYLDALVVSSLIIDDKNGWI